MRSEGHWNTHTTTLEGRTPKALHLVAGMTAKERKRKKIPDSKGTVLRRIYGWKGRKIDM